MRFCVWCSCVLLGVGCADTSNPEETNAEELITTVVLELSDGSGSDPVMAVWEDLGSGATVDEVRLSDALDYSLSVRFLNALEEPAEEITEEVAAESGEHQVFFTGTAVRGPASNGGADTVLEHAYADADDAGLPVGLENSLGTLAVGAGTLEVTLRHLPVQDGVPTKTEGLAEAVAVEGFGAIGGESDVSVRFDVVVE
jgi:hypothetical protein